uniref:Uncharacterized protein n=1 Tax=Panagrolaimus sp. JU765 TaxID=591449 RepID=A0AC34QMX8_9BILA
MQTRIVSIAVFAALFAVAHGLRCYESQMSVNMTVTGSPTDCAYGAQACLKTVNGYQVTRNCQMLPCSMTLAGQQNRICATDQYGATQCCCNTDGCNSAPNHFLSVFLLPFTAFGFYNVF